MPTIKDESQPQTIIQNLNEPFVSIKIGEINTLEYFIYNRSLMQLFGSNTRNSSRVQTTKIENLYESTYCAVKMTNS